MAKTQPKIDDIKGLTQWINFLWLKLKDLFSDESATTNDNYLPKIDDINKKLVKSNINDDGTNPKYNTNTIWHSGNDGSGSGLDADTLDGKHASDFAGVDHNHDTTYLGIDATATDSDMLDGKHASDFAQLESGKILEGNLPDYIFGQVLFGGFIAINTSTNKLVCTLSAKLKSKYNILVDTLLLEDMPAANYEGVYFMATNSWNTQPNDGQVGDWLISNGITWSKVDNSDAVSSVNGQTGAVVLTHADVGAASSNHTHNYGSLTDINGDDVDLQAPGEVGVWALIPGQSYVNTPNPICGTDKDPSTSLSGTYTYVENIEGGTWTYHDQNTNKMYISSWYNDPVNGYTVNTWKRLLTCRDETNVVIGEEDEYSYTIDRSNTEIYIDRRFDPKSDIIEIEISSFKDIIVAQIGFKIIFSSPITGGVTVVINNGTSKPISYTQFYQNPSAYAGTINEIQYTIWNRYSDWLYHNRIL